MDSCLPTLIHKTPELQQNGISFTIITKVMFSQVCVILFTGSMG